MRALDEVLPAYDFDEVHSIEVAAEPEAAVAAFLATPAAADRFVGGLFRLRGLRTGGSIEESLTRMGFAFLHRAPTEVVLGGAGRLSAEGGVHPFTEARTGDVRMAIDVRATRLGDGRCALTTETRVSATDARSRRLFRWYWRVVRPFSGLIRRRWLRAARDHAEQH